MANIFTYQVLKDTTEKAVIKLTANFDGSGQEANNTRIQANTLYGALATNGYLVANTQGGAANTALSAYTLAVTRIGYNIASRQQGYVELSWNGSTVTPILNMDMCGQYSEDQGVVSIPNNAPGYTGDIGVTSYGMIANCAYTLIVELRKGNDTYQRGQFNDASAFNYKPYGVTP